MPRHLLLLAERFPPDIGGVSRSAARTAQRMSELGLNCEVFTWTKTQPPGQLTTTTLDVPQQANSIRVHRLGLFANLDFSLQHTMNVVEWLHQNQPFDAIWGHYLYPSGFVAVVLARSLKIASTVSARGNDIDRLMFPPGDFARLQWTLCSADVVTAVSRHLAQKIQILAPDIETPLVVHNSVDTDVFAPAPLDDDLRRSLGIYPPELVLGFCGELRHKKGLPFLLNALREFRIRRPTCLLVIGNVRERERSSIAQYLAEDEATRRRILVTDPIEAPVDVARHLRLCDVILHPSVWEGLPNAVLEAMACERLVVASDAGGIPEIIDHGRNGYLVPRAHLHRLGAVISEVLALPEEERDQVRRAARQRVKQQFHGSREAAALQNLLERLMPKTSS